MISFLALCIPPVILMYVRNCVFDLHMSKERNIVCYLMAGLGLNWLMLLILCIGFSIHGTLSENLNHRLDFACKYIALSSLIAVIEPFAERLIRKQSCFRISLPHVLPQFCCWKLWAVIYSSILFFMNFIRIFDNNFWGDEAYTTNLVQGSMSEIIEGTAADVHPPLYYILVKLVYTIFGKQGWAFHLVSLIPVAILIVFALTAVWKKFGKGAAIIFITFLCLSPNAVHFNVEVRMYSWGVFFVALSFYFFYCILDGNRAKDYILFVFFSLAAAYTHYYCLASVAFFYLALLILAFVKKKTELKKVILAYAITIVGYSPWFFIMIRSMLDRASNYWIEEIPSFQESMNYVFSRELSTGQWIVLGLALIIALAYETGILVINRSKEGGIFVSFDISRFSISNFAIWIIAGLLSVIGTIGFGIGISNLIRPFYLLRYIYPVSAVMWLLLGIIISRLKGSKLYTVVLLLYLLTVFFPVYRSTYTIEKKANTKLTNTLEATEGIENSDVILTNASHIDLQIAPYYYPNLNYQLVTLTNMPELDKNTVYWLVISGEEAMEKPLRQIEEQGFLYEQIVNDGILGNHPVDIYKLMSDL